ncbi:MAG: ATP-grasp domain-containing protein [Gammaproteobacteria bacterium]|nr:ATP-grasp domain-containing protein [Gammaproteobacteria bacterium]
MTKKKLVILHSAHWSAQLLPHLIAQCSDATIRSIEFVFLSTDVVLKDGIKNTIKRLSVSPPDGVVGMDDDASQFASIMTEKMDLIGPEFSSIANIQNKYRARCTQLDIVPHATPAFKLASQVLAGDPFPGEFPVIIKPVRSCLSLDTYVVHNKDELNKRLRQIQHIKPSTEDHQSPSFGDFRRDQSILHPTEYEHIDDTLIEAYALGEQYTVDGYLYKGKCVFLGYTLSEFLPDTLSFSRFSFPHHFTATTQEYIESTLKQYLLASGLNNTMFNAEFRFDQKNHSMAIIEVNTRIAFQFIQMIYHVNGISSIEYMTLIALGESPEKLKTKIGKRHALASSCVMRRNTDALVTKIPNEEQIALVRKYYPDVQIVNLVPEGQKLSDVGQDSYTFRYAWINIPGDSREHIDEQLVEITDILDYQFEEL